MKPQVDIREYGSVTDNQLATSLLLELRNKIYESANIIVDILVQSLSSVTEVWYFFNGLELLLPLVSLSLSDLSVFAC